MLTIRYINGDGVESLTECMNVVADKIEGDTSAGKRRVLTFDNTPSYTMDNATGVYVNDGRASSSGPVTGPVVYVMNRFGATVATYRL